MERTEPPLIVITGPTASGKTGLAVSLAAQFGGEIISADSRAIYRGVDIGSAKPSAEERQGVLHWGFDLVDPGDRFTAADFKRYALEKINEIRMRGNVPFLVGGTGLYVDSILFDYQFGADRDTRERHKLELMSKEELYEYCINNNISIPENMNNKRYLVRAIEQKGINNMRRLEPIENVIVVGIATDKEELRTRITLRAEQILTNGVVEEAIMLGKKYGWESEAMTGNVYPLVRLYLAGELTVQELKDKFTTADWQLAKRQMTWLRRNPSIYWGSIRELQEYIAARLSSELC